MTLVCTWHIRSATRGTLPTDFLRPGKRREFELVDNQSPEMRARRERVRSKLGLPDLEAPRYHWRLCSEGQVTDDDLHKHLQWLLNHIKPERTIGDLLDAGFESWISASWTGNGTGGGPLISLDTSALLLRHRTEMGVSFYLET